MSYLIAGGALVTEPTKLTTTGATSLLPAALDAKRVMVLSIVAAEINGSTPTLTYELNDGTTSHYFRKAKAMAANTPETFSEPFVKPAKWTLKATAGSANQIDVMVTYLAPDATGRT